MTAHHRARWRRRQRLYRSIRMSWLRKWTVFWFGRDAVPLIAANEWWNEP